MATHGIAHTCVEFFCAFSLRKNRSIKGPRGKPALRRLLYKEDDLAHGALPDLNIADMLPQSDRKAGFSRHTIWPRLYPQ